MQFVRLKDGTFVNAADIKRLSGWDAPRTVELHDGTILEISKDTFMHLISQQGQTTVPAASGTRILFYDNAENGGGLSEWWTYDIVAWQCPPTLMASTTGFRAVPITAMPEDEYNECAYSAIISPDGKVSGDHGSAGSLDAYLKHCDATFRKKGTTT